MMSSSRNSSGRLAIKANRIFDPDETRILNLFVHITTLIPHSEICLEPSV